MSARGQIKFAISKKICFSNQIKISLIITDSGEVAITAGFLAGKISESGLCFFVVVMDVIQTLRKKLAGAQSCFVFARAKTRISRDSHKAGIAS